MNTDPQIDDGLRSGPLERARAASRALSDAARRARFSGRARAAYRGGSFDKQRGAGVLKVLVVGSFWLVVALPVAASVLYFGFMASNQYVSEVKFTVSSGALPVIDGVGSITGIPPLLVIQDTQIVTSYIQSRPMVEYLDRVAGLREHYGARTVDWWARFHKGQPIEKLVRYWGRMTDASINLPSGIVSFEIFAFDPYFAKRLAEAVVERSEELVNELNSKMIADTVIASEQDLRVAAQTLAEARAKLERGRNQEGVVNLNDTSKNFSALIASVQEDLVKSEEEFHSQQKYLKLDSPQMRLLVARIATLRRQLDAIRRQMASVDTPDAKQTLSKTMTRLSELELDVKIAEKRYAVATESLEAARILGERRMLYIHQIVHPGVAEEARYPRRILTIAAVLAGSLGFWGIFVAIIAFARNYMA